MQSAFVAAFAVVSGVLEGSLTSGANVACDMSQEESKLVPASPSSTRLKGNSRSSVPFYIRSSHSARKSYDNKK